MEKKERPEFLFIGFATEFFPRNNELGAQRLEFIGKKCSRGKILDVLENGQFCAAVRCFCRVFCIKSLSKNMLKQIEQNVKVQMVKYLQRYVIAEYGKISPKVAKLELKLVYIQGNYWESSRAAILSVLTSFEPKRTRFYGIAFHFADEIFIRLHIPSFQNTVLRQSISDYHSKLLCSRSL